MGLQINIAEAQARLAELLARAEAGEDVIIARGGRPIARLVPLQPRPRPEPPPRRPGLASHWRNDPDWDRLNKALLEPMSEEELAIAEGRHHDDDFLWEDRPVRPDTAS